VDDLLKPVEPLVKSCGDKVECYLQAVEKSEFHTREKQLAGIKASYMIGVLGDAKARDALVDRISSIENDAVHYTALAAIDQLSPKAAPDVVKVLDGYIEKNEKSGDADKLSKNQPLKQVASRISVR